MKVTRHKEMILSVKLTREEIEVIILQRLKQKYPSQIITQLERVSWYCNDYGMEGADFHFIKPQIQLDESFEEL